MKLMYSEAVSGTEDTESSPPAIITTYEDVNGKLQGLDPILYLDPSIKNSEKIAKVLVILYNHEVDINDEISELTQDGN